MRKYTLRQIDTFWEICRDLSVSSAATRLHITQPAVSMQLRQLEDAVGLPLTEHVGRRIKLTAVGEEFRQYASDAIAQLQTLDDVVNRAHGLRGGSVIVAIVSTAKYFVPMLLVHFRRKHPGITIKLLIDNREAIIGRLARNEIDLVIMGRSPDEIDCIAQPFATNPLGIVAAPEHPLSRRKRAPLSILKDELFVVRETGSGTRQAMDRFFAKHKMKLNVAMEMPSNETIKQAVMAGMGLSFLSVRTVRHELASGRLALLDIVGLPIMRDWYVTHLSNKRLSPAAVALRDFLLREGGPLVEVWA